MSMGTVRYRTGAGIATLAMGMAMMATGSTGAVAQESLNPVVESARQVSADPRPARLYVTPELAVDPSDPDTVVIGVGEARFGGCRLYVSRDGGLTWLETAQDMLIDPYDSCIRRPFGRSVAPVFTPDGDRLYVGFEGADKEGTNYPNGPTAALFASTEDLGLAVDTTVVQEPQDLDVPDTGETVKGQNEMANVAVDPTNPDRVYRAWRRQSTSPASAVEERGGFPPGTFSVDGLHSMVAVSEDGGASWSQPTDLTIDVGGDEMKGGTSDLPSLVTDSDGTVYAFTRERRPRGEDPALPTRLLMFTSTDHGDSWAMSSVGEFENGLTTPDAASDPTTDDLYVSYEASRPIDGATGEDPTMTSRVEFVTSSDGGQTWSDPVDVVDPEAIDGADQYFPGISVAPNGRIDIAWYDFRDDPFHDPSNTADDAPPERYANIYYGYSTDGGRTWSANIRATDRLIDESLGVAFAGSTRGPVGIGSSDDAAFLTWSDTRAADPVNNVEDVYMTRIRTQPELSPAAAPASDGPNVVGIGLGAGGALVIGGLLLLLSAGRRRRRLADESGTSEDT